MRKSIYNATIEGFLDYWWKGLNQSWRISRALCARALEQETHQKIIISFTSYSIHFCVNTSSVLFTSSTDIRTDVGKCVWYFESHPTPDPHPIHKWQISVCQNPIFSWRIWSRWRCEDTRVEDNMMLFFINFISHPLKISLEYDFLIGPIKNDVSGVRKCVKYLHLSAWALESTVMIP